MRCEGEGGLPGAVGRAADLYPRDAWSLEVDTSFRALMSSAISGPYPLSNGSSFFSLMFDRLFSSQEL